MGSRSTSLGSVAGRAWYLRMKGLAYIEAARNWITPVSIGAAATKYLGFSVEVSIAFWVGVALLGELLMVGLGWLERRTGATEANYELAATLDTYKRESLRLYTEILNELRRLRRGDPEQVSPEVHSRAE